MLLVDDGEPQTLEDDIVLQQRVRPHDNPQTAILQRRVDTPPLLLRGAARQQRTLHRSRLKILLDIGIMLLRQHLGRCHDAGLVAVAHGHQAAQHRHHRLARTHVPLQQPVHLVPAHEVGANLLDHALLRPGQGIGEGVVAGVEVRPHLGHQDPSLAAGTDVFLLEQRELQEEEFLELEAPGGLLQGIAVLREMNILERIRQGHQRAVGQDVFRERLADLGQAEREGGGLQLVHHLAGDPACLELLRTGIYPGQRPLRERPVLGHVHLRMHDVHAGPEGLRFAEKEEGGTGDEPLVVPAYPLEKHHLHPP